MLFRSRAKYSDSPITSPRTTTDPPTALIIRTILTDEVPVVLPAAVVEGCAWVEEVGGDPGDCVVEGGGAAVVTLAVLLETDLVVVDEVDLVVVDGVVLLAGVEEVVLGVAEVVLGKTGATTST